MARVLRTVRLGRGETLKDVSRRSAVSLGYISDIEHGEKQPSTGTINRLCSALEIRLSQFVRLTADDMDKEQQ